MDDKKQNYIGEFEELVLLAVMSLSDDAYGTTIWQKLEGAGRSVAMGALYTTLERLQEKGYVSSKLGEATAQRGGRPKRYYRIEGAGEQAIRDAERVRTQLRPIPHPAGGMV